MEIGVGKSYFSVQYKAKECFQQHTERLTNSLLFLREGSLARRRNIIILETVFTKNTTRIRVNTLMRGKTILGM